MSTQSHIDKVELKPNLMEYPHHVGAPKIIPQIYHLYEDKNGGKFLSIIEPELWSQKFLYSAVLNSDMTWSRII